MQDAKMFRRKKWKYLILDEAHMIKNWKSQRWQTLLNFNSKRRLLITGQRIFANLFTSVKVTMYRPVARE